MPTGFVAVLAGPGEPAADLRQALLTAGAATVLTWAELRNADPDDQGDVAAVLLEGLEPADGTLSADLVAVLSALAEIDGASEPAAGPTGAVVVTTRPVTDTLKLVDAAGTLVGTAQRDDHRFVGTPIAARLPLLRSVAAAGPDPVAVLTALAGRGVTVIGTAG
jgi:hypothetical protein